MSVIIALSGQANSGKSTIAEIIKEKVVGSEIISLSDPIKQLAAYLFGFSNEQLWGASSSRSIPSIIAWDTFEKNVTSHDFLDGWLATYVTPYHNDGHDWSHMFFCMWATYFKGKEYVKSTREGLTPRVVLQSLGTEFGRRIQEDLWIKIALKSDVKKVIIVPDIRFVNEAKILKNKGGLLIRISTGEPEQQLGHISETEFSQIPVKLFDAVIVNDKTGLEKLKHQVICTVNSMLIDKAKERSKILFSKK